MLRTKLGRLLTVTALVATQACGDGGAKPAPQDPFDDGMDAGTTPRDAGRRDSGSVDAGPVTGPLIEVLDPAETDDAASTDVVRGATLTVRCSVKRNPKGELIDTKTVKVSIYPGDETKAVVSQVATSTSETDVFQAENISLAGVPHGLIRIECSASDLATKVQSNSASIQTLYDQGPKITFLSPMEKGYVAVGDGKQGIDVIVRFKVEPQLLADDDEGAEISAIKASVGGKDIATLDPSTTEENVYSFGLDFSDTQVFTAIPKNLSLRVDATNSRAPKPRTVTATLSVGVDSEGPVIAVKNPARVEGQDPVVSGKVDVLMEIKDVLAGVNAESVDIRVEKLGGGKDTYHAVSQGNGLYLASFETGSYPGLPSLNVTLVARDNVSIETTSNLSIDVDTVPPWLTMDAPTVRELNDKAPLPNDCSGPFDPLGEAVTEGVVTGSAFTPRVIIWDRPLKLPNDSIPVRYAMIDNTSARLYIQHNVAVPLLVDTDSDANHECDQINNNSEDTTKAPVPLVLSPVKPTGLAPQCGVELVSAGPPAVYRYDFTSEPSIADRCNQPTVTTQGPVAADTIMTRVIKHTSPGEYPVVYADSPTPSGVRLVGKAYVSARTGWACLVAVAKDNAGNFGFSPPMRVCIDGGTGICATTPAPTTCTDGCIVPAKFLADAPDKMPRVLYYRK